MELHKSAHVTNDKPKTPYLWYWILGSGGIVLVWLIVVVWSAMDRQDARRRAAWEERDRNTYAAWVKLTDRSDITLEEFLLMKRARLPETRTTK